MKVPMLIAFSTQKGGAGKTTLTVLMASYLHYVKGYNVGVVDCDYPQYSIHDMRERDMESALKDDYYKVMAYEQFKRLGKKAYTIKCGKPEEALSVVEQLTVEEPGLDFIFFDLPGTVNGGGIIRTIASMDYIFCPIAADRVVMESSFRFASVINEHLISTGKSRLKGLHLLWNMVDGREKSELYNVYEKVAAEVGVPILKTFLPDSKRFRKEAGQKRKAVFRSTVFPADKVLVKGSNLDKLVDEVLAIVKE